MYLLCDKIHCMDLSVKESSVMINEKKSDLYIAKSFKKINCGFSFTFKITGSSVELFGLLSQLSRLNLITDTFKENCWQFYIKINII
jgi:hypothetical protein